MQPGPEPGPRPRARRRKPRATIVDAVAPTVPAETAAFEAPTFEEPAFSEPEAEPGPAPEPIIVESTGVALEENVQPIYPPPPVSNERTDFFFPPRPRTSQPEQEARTDRYAPGGQSSARQPEPRPAAPPGPSAQERTQAILRALLAFLLALWRVLRKLAKLSARGYRRALLPGQRRIWHWIVDDPYAPPRASQEASLLQGRVLGVYQYHLYQRVLLGILGGIPLALAALYALYEFFSEVRFGFDSRLFLVQDVAGAATGFFGCLILVRLATIRITLRSDGVEYKAMFRVVRSRWEEVGVLKVEYYRRSERWIVGTGRGAWAFLFVGMPTEQRGPKIVRALRLVWGVLTRSQLGLPKGRQLAKLITIYARLGPTGTPYWLPMVGRFTQDDPLSRTPVTMPDQDSPDSSYSPETQEVSS